MPTVAGWACAAFQMLKYHKVTVSLAEYRSSVNASSEVWKLTFQCLGLSSHLTCDTAEGDPIIFCKAMLMQELGDHRHRVQITSLFFA